MPRAPGAIVALDHLVLAAATLQAGLDWCETTFGLCPREGGRHAFMGTHNRVFSISSAAFPRAYFEIIAIDPDATEPLQRRWFDLDDPALRRALEGGPRLVHWVARCDAIAVTRAALRSAGVEAGEVQSAERATPHGLLRWQITIRADGGRALDGAAPALIEWGERHPSDALPDSGVVLESMRIGGWPEGVELPAAVERDAAPNAAPITAVFATPRGRVVLESLRCRGDHVHA